jgi:predicted Na+-dependent transporter
MRTELGRYALRYQELLMVALAAILGLTVRRPFVWLVAHHGIDIFLVILVFSTALSIEAISLRRLPALWRPVTLTLVVGITVLPFLSWLASHLVAPGALRDGVVVIGLAPCEIASIATTAMAAGDAALAGGILIGSTALTVALAGPVLTLESPGASLHPWHILVTLVVVVVLPLGAGIALRALRPLPEATLTAASTISTWSLAVLVALVAAEVHLSRHYLPVLLAVLALVAASDQECRGPHHLHAGLRHRRRYRRRGLRSGLRRRPGRLRDRRAGVGHRRGRPHEVADGVGAGTGAGSAWTSVATMSLAMRRYPWFVGCTSPSLQ